MAASACQSSHGSFCLLLLLLLAAAAVLGAAGSSSHVHLSAESLLLPADSSSCPTPQEQQHGAATGTRMPIVHQHGPCSPLADKRGKAPSHTEILAADQRRVEYIHRRMSESTGRGARPKRGAAPVQLRPGAPSAATTPASSASSSYATSANLPASSGEELGTGNYVVTIGLGTPSKQFTVVFDTGSDTTWVQCRPCVAYCYRQQEPLFSPAKSSTYANISCTSSYCDDLDTSGCDGGHCLYGVQYGDGSYTIGFFAQDTLTLAHDAVKEFRFGCGEKNRGLFGQSAGLMGLGRGKTSLTVQAYGKYGGVFAYCLPATPSGTSGFLDFGPGAPAANARLTPMLTGDVPTFYYVGMTGIKVGGHLLPIPESVFSAGGALVDSGTVITRLPPSAYEPMRSAFAKAMDALGYKKAPAYSILDTCYDLTGYKGSIALPAVALVFKGGACLDVDASGILYVADVSQACLAFAANDDDTDVAIVGNTQQKTYSVLYDLGKKVVGFAPGASDNVLFSGSASGHGFLRLPPWRHPPEPPPRASPRHAVRRAPTARRRAVPAKISCIGWDPEGILGAPTGGHIARLEFRRRLESDSEAREAFERQVREEKERRRSEREARVIPDTDAGLVEFFLDTEAREIEVEIGRLRPRLNEGFFNHISREIAQIKFAVTRTAEMEDRLIELEAMQKVLLEGVEAYDKLQNDLVTAKERLMKILQSADRKATLLEMVERNELNISILTLLDENIASAKTSNQDAAVAFMENVRSSIVKYITV